MRATGLGPLADGAKVVVIGGGPGGASSAIALQQGAQALGKNVRVIVIEGKQFAGAQHHNQCAGVLSPPIVDLIEGELRIPFPYQLSRGSIKGYILHTSKEVIVLDGQVEPSVTVRRVQFDGFILDKVCERGIEVLQGRATGLEFHADKVIVFTESRPLDADVVVGAFGLDEGTAHLFERTVDYRPPPALDSIVTKYHPGDQAMAAFGDRIQAFLLAIPHIEFGAITPKGNHLTINIGGRTVDVNRMDQFLAHPKTRRALLGFENARRFDSGDLRYFKGRFPCGLASNYTGDRFIILGDAAGLVRAFKGKGVTSAIQTGIRAAETILHQGISSEAFLTYRAANHDITTDQPYGKAVRQFTILASRIGLMDAITRAAENEPGLRQALFDAISGHRIYREVLRKGITPASILAVLQNWPIDFSSQRSKLVSG